MRRVFLSFLFFIISLEGRDPFDPLIIPEDSKRPYYGEKNFFSSADIALPSTARLIKKVEITYQNIDGSIDSVYLNLNGKIDWRSPLNLSHSPLKKSPPSTSKWYYINDNNIYIQYMGALQRDFIMQNPYRIVLDFDINMKYLRKKINLNNKYFKSIRYGLHDNFIRVVVELSGDYVYSLRKDKNGVNINVK